MKIALLVLTAAASVLRLPAAVPLSWTVETTRAQPATFEAYQGETLTFEAALQSRGKPLEAPLNYSFFWQTNGMGSTYWEVKVRGEGEQRNNSTVHLDPSPSPTNVLFATWSPEMDVGAKVYNCFIGSPSNIYHAAFQLRLRPSPGALPNALPLPTPVIDFARVRVLNPPWSGGGGGGVDTNAVIDIANATIETNVLVVATTNRVAALVTATNNLTSSVSGLQSSKANRAESGHADEIATLDADGNPTRSGIAKTSVATKTDLEGYLPLTGGDLTGNLYGFGASLGDGSLYLGNGMIYPYADPRSSFGPPMIADTQSGFILYHSDDIPGNPTWHYGQTPTADNEIAVKGDLDDYLPLTGGELSGGVYAQQAIASATTVGAQTIDAWADIRLGSETYYLHNEDECLADYNGKFAHESMISAADPTFSNAVLSVGINTNLVASIGELNDFIHGYGELGATSVGGLILALLGAAALLRKKTAKLDNSGNATDAFATDLLGKQVAISAVQNIVNGMFDNGDTTAYPRTTGEG